MTRRWPPRIALAASVLMVSTVFFLPSLAADLVMLGAISAASAWSFMRPAPGPRWVIVGQLVMFATITAQDLAQSRHWPLAPIITIKHWITLPLALLLILIGFVKSARSNRISQGEVAAPDAPPSA